MMKARIVLLILVLTATGLSQAANFSNPSLPSGPDPWVTYYGGFYYYMNTTATNLMAWKTAISDRSTANQVHTLRKIVLRSTHVRAIRIGGHSSDDICNIAGRGILTLIAAALVAWPQNSGDIGHLLRAHAQREFVTVPDEYNCN